MEKGRYKPTEPPPKPYLLRGCVLSCIFVLFLVDQWWQPLAQIMTAFR